jgi:phosphoglycerate dehydrogenase-like enzyme
MTPGEPRGKEGSVAPKILFAPSQPQAVLDLLRGLAPPGFELVVTDLGTPEFYQAAADAQYYLGLARGMGGEFFRSAPNLKLVQLLSAGYDQVNVEAARKAGVPVANNGGANAIAVSEHTILLMLAVFKRLVRLHNDVVAGKWRVGNLAEPRIHELAGKTLGIVGLGNIGKKVARRAAAFDVRVQYYDIARLTEDAEDALGVRFVLFDELLATSDVVSLHVPLDDSTRHLIGARELALMKPTAILINTCRGPVVDEQALYRALSEKRILGAGLDVMVEEPPAPTHPLFTLPNVTLTPHSAGPTWENWTARFRNGFDNIQRVAAGKRPLWVIPELDR